MKEEAIRQSLIEQRNLGKVYKRLKLYSILDF